MNTIKSTLLAVFILLCGLSLKAQNKPTQTAFKLFFEKVYLHTDRDIYSQGDTIWYKAYLLNAQNNQPIGTSGNLYVELISQDSAQVINRETLRLDYGAGNGDFQLNDSIPSGKYTLRAYTNWMRNFGDNFIFQKELTITNTTVKTSIASPQNSEPVKAAKIEAQKVPQVINTPVVRFYPESGSLIEGVGSLVAVKAEDRSGKGISASGAVFSSAGDTVARFTCDTLGMGIFVLQPLTGQLYHAQVIVNEKKTIADLPSALSKGFALRVTHTDSLINIIISCNDAQLAEAKGKAFTLTGKHGGKTCFSRAIQITDNQLLLTVSNTLFPDGVAAITLSDDQNKPHCERLVYVHHNNTTNAISITTDKGVYQSKEKVTAHIKTNGDKANLSMAVIDASLVPVQTQNIESYLMLQSEIKGTIEHPIQYFDTTNVSRYKHLDLLLMTQGWRDFVWRRLADSAIRISYQTEDGIDITGKVKNEKSDSPLPGLNVTLYASATKGAKLFSSTTGADGRFSFTGLQYYGANSVKLSSVNAKGEKKGTFVMDTLTTIPVKQQIKQNLVDAPADTTSALVKAIAKRQSAIKAGSINSVKNLKEVKITATKAVVTNNGSVFTTWGADQSFDITPKDYQYKTLEWFALQKIKGAMQSQGTSSGIVVPCVDTLGYVVTMPDGTVRRLYRSTTILLSPQFFINGVDYSTDDDNEAETYRTIYYPLPIDKFKRIVFKHTTGILPNAKDPQASTIMVDRYFIYLTLKDDAMVGYNPGSLRPAVNGYYEAKTFYKPQYDNTSKDLNKPDLRTTIHWEPNITTDAKGEATVTYYNADPKTQVRIIVEGVKATGGPVVGGTAYSIK